MASTADPVDKNLLSEFADGARKAFENAEALFREAKILHGAGALSRSLFLHQISLEECAKIEMLGAWATTLLMGHKVDVATMSSAMSRHANKNRTNAYFLDGSDEEEAAKRDGDYDRAHEAFRKMQKEFHETTNTAKNASLYVDFEGGNFVAPVERITAEMLSHMGSLNEQFLGYAFPKVEMLQKWASNPEPILHELVDFEKRLRELREQYSDDPMKAMNVMLDEMLERRNRTLKEAGDPK